MRTPASNVSNVFKQDFPANQHFNAQLQPKLLTSRNCGNGMPYPDKTLLLESERLPNSLAR